jgi:hypothetical protein
LKKKHKPSIAFKTHVPSERHRLLASPMSNVLPLGHQSRGFVQGVGVRVPDSQEEESICKRLMSAD